MSLEKNNKLEYTINVLGPKGIGKTTMINYFNNIKPQLLPDGKILYTQH